MRHGGLTRDPNAQIYVLDRLYPPQNAFLALRTDAGLDAERFAREFGAPPRSFYRDAIDALREQDLLRESEDGRLRLTPRGRMLSDSVFAHFV